MRRDGTDGFFGSIFFVPKLREALPFTKFYFKIDSND